MQPGSKLRATSIAVLAVVAIVGRAAVVAGIRSFGNRADEAGAVLGSVQVAGSESMRPVVTRCAEDFMTRNPQADIIVKGGGSGDGIAALLHGLVDIGMASRELSRRELDYAQSQGVSLAVSGLALDGISTVVNRAVSLGALELGNCATSSGKTRNWRELGGEAIDILVFARAEGSGTAALFAERVLGGEFYGASVSRLSTNEAIVAEVAARPGAIGYSDLGVAKLAGDRIRVLALRREAQARPILPTSATVRDGS